jgi:hypothetical protein
MARACYLDEKQGRAIVKFGKEELSKSFMVPASSGKDVEKSAFVLLH